MAAAAFLPAPMARITVGGTGDRIAAGVDLLPGGLHRGLINDDAAVPVGGKARVVRWNSGYGEVPSAMMTVSASRVELAARYRLGTAAAGGVRFAELHLDAGDAGDEAVGALDLHRVAEQAEGRRPPLWRGGSPPGGRASPPPNGGRRR